MSIIGDLIHTHPVFVRMAFAAKSPHGVALVTDAVAASTATAAATASAPTVGPPRLSDGTLAGSVLTMDGAVSNVVNHCHVAFTDALEAASTTPARLLGFDDRGALTPGRRADLVALEEKGDGGWRVASVWVAGTPAWSAPPES